MAVTISVYRHVPKLILAKEIDWDNVKLELLNATAAFNGTHTTKNAVDNTGAYEVSGNGWTAGGELLDNAAITIAAITSGTADDAKLDYDDIIVTATGGSIGPAYGALVYDVTGGFPLLFIDFGQSQAAGDTTDFKIRIHANGLINLTM